MNAAVVKALPWHLYPPVQGAGEPLLDVQRMDRCACGGHVVQLVGERVLDVVVRHNDSAEHVAWRAWRETAP
jgi:hypothetical protein